MHPNNVPASVLAAAMNASAVEPEHLNSERIEERFGSYGIDVLENTPELRRSNLFSHDGDRPVCRTYAIVCYRAGAPSIAAEHAEVVSGNSIGAIFKSKGWSIYKQTLHIGDFDASPTAFASDLMDLPDGAVLSLHVYRLQLKKDEQIIDYADIIEVHHPAYLDRDTLASLYPVDSGAGLSATALKAVFELVDGAPA